MGKLPLYSAVIENYDDGIFAISLVDCPATETNWQCFKKDEKPIEMSIENEEEHIIASVVMLADTPIYRRDDSGYEYNIIYHKDTIKLMAEKMLKDCSHNNIDINHNGNLLERGKVSLVELFIKDTENGINPPYFSQIPEGSLIAKYKIHDIDLWQMCKDGTLNGISLAGYFSTKQENFKNKIKPIKSNMLKKIKEALKSMLLNFGEVKTDNGILYYDGEELAEGMAVTDENGESVEDGEYKLEDGTVLTVKDSKVETITKPTTEDEEEAEDDKKEDEEETPEDEKKKEDEEEMEDEEPNAEVEALKGEIEAMKAEIESLKATIEEISNKLNTPMAEPIAEEFKKAVEVKENKAAKIAAYLKA